MLLRSGVLLVAFCLATTADAQERRLALVIGNDAYAELPTLKKAVNDARAVGDTLAAIGFRVLRGENLNRPARPTVSFQTSKRRIQPGDQAVDFFAGHGVAIRGENILLPVDMPKPRAGDEGRPPKKPLSALTTVQSLQEVRRQKIADGEVFGGLRGSRS